MTDDQETPAKTVELDEDDVDHALRLDFESRHAALDGHAHLYQQMIGLLAYLDQYTEPAVEAMGGDVVRNLREILITQRDAIQEHVLEEYEHALRWTLDPYDEMEP